MVAIGTHLRTIRRRWQLSLREVEERSVGLANLWGSRSFFVSASWLNRVESGKHELTISKLAALADIYKVPTEQLLLQGATTPASDAPHRRAIIGKRDLMLNPMIPPGSVIKIDTGTRHVAKKGGWISEFQRPVYLLATRKAYICSWCELDDSEEWLTLIPHPLSSSASYRLRYRSEIEVIGRVTSIAIPLVD
jgi:transcriptional regulator with XRE-family HTH domain